MENLLELAQSNGPEGLGIGLAVLLIVFGLNAAGVAVNSNWKRILNLVFSFGLGGVGLLGNTQDEMIVSAIGAISSGLVYELIQYLAAKRKAAA